MTPLLLLSSWASAATWTVGPTHPHTTIQQALSVAAIGDVVEVEGGVYLGPVVVDRDIAVVGLAGSAGTSIVAVGLDPAVSITGNATVSGFDVFGADEAALDIADATVVTLEDIRVGGMNVGGAAIRVGAAAEVVILHAELVDNENGFGLGGHLYVADDAVVDLYSASLTGGLAARGGAIFAEPSAQVAVHDVLFAANTAVQGGHVVGVAGCFDSVFRDGLSSDIGGAGQDSCQTTLGSVFEGNTASGDGGALYFTGGRGIDIRDSAFVANAAGGNGGAIRMGNDLDPDPRVERSYFCENRASGLGGGIYSHFWSDVAGGLSLGRLTVQNTVFAANDPSAITHSSQHHDGTAGGPVDATYNTFVDNPAGGLDQFLSELPEVIGNIFVGHGAAYTDASPYRFDNGMQHDNLWFDNLTDAISDYLPSASAVFADPELVDWSDDGDCWNDDFRLGAGSPAIDAGDPSDVDVDGSPADIGAYGGPDAPTEAMPDRFEDLDPGPDPTLPTPGQGGPPDLPDPPDPPDPADDPAPLEDPELPEDPADPDLPDPAEDDDGLSDDDDDPETTEGASDSGDDPELPELPDPPGELHHFQRFDPCPGGAEIDSDGDGVYACSDCDDSDPSVQTCAASPMLSRQAELGGGGGCGCATGSAPPVLGWLVCLVPLVRFRRRR